jgi:hypothetical protein
MVLYIIRLEKIYTVIVGHFTVMHYIVGLPKPRHAPCRIAKAHQCLTKEVHSILKYVRKNAIPRQFYNRNVLSEAISTKCASEGAHKESLKNPVRSNHMVPAPR